MVDPAPLWAWANERHAIYLRKAKRENPSAFDHQRDTGFDPENRGEWLPGTSLTADPILDKFRFCNVFRELDRVTVWVRENIREPYADHPDLWLMLAIARYINWPETLHWLMSDYENHPWGAWPSNITFDPAELGSALDEWSRRGKKVYTGAYMIRAESNPNAEWYSWTKQQYIARIVIGRLWEDREIFRDYLSPTRFKSAFDYGPTVEGFWNLLQQPRYIGWGPFMAYQVCVDMMWTRYLKDAPDANTWAAVGPGSRRGLNRLAGRSVDFNLSQEQGLEEMLEIYRTQDQYRAPWVPEVRLSDIQNCLCETDKYLRVKLGEGKPRAQYVPGRGY